jgi:hypothetical protein
MSPQIVIPTVFAILSLLNPAFAEAITAAANLRPLLPRQNSDPGSTSCDAWLSIEDSCTAQTSNFVNLDFTVQASCLCYSSTVWQPSVFDNDFDTCLEYLSTASPSAYSALGGNTLPTNPCALAGNVVANTAGSDTGTATTSAAIGGSASLPTPKPTASSSQDPNDLACLSWNAIQLSCSSSIPSFSALPFSVEASCLCYKSSTYIGSVYDDYWGSCLNYFSTASPVFYSSTLGGDTVQRTPCAAEALYTATTSVGSVISSAFINSAGSGATASAPSSSVSQTSMALTTTEPTGTSSNDAAVVGQGRSVVVMLTGLLALIFV